MKHKIVISPVFGFATEHELKCLECGRKVHIVYRKDMWPLAWWYRHNSQ